MNSIPAVPVLARGARGPVGPSPAFDWNGSRLRFANPDGSEGAYVNLLGPEGPAGNATTFFNKAYAQGAIISGGIDAITIVCYASILDGGGARYQKVASQPAHAGKLQTTDGAWWELAETVINVNMFGAIGDGATDDTVAIQAALDYLAVKGKTIYFLPLTYLITASLNCSANNITLEGAGQGRTLIKAKNAAGIVSMFNMSGSKQRIRRLTIDGNRLNGLTYAAFIASGLDGGTKNMTSSLPGTNSNTAGITGTGLRFTLDDVEIKFVGFQGIICGAGASGLKIRDCYFHDIGDVADKWGAGVKVIGSPDGIDIVDCWFENNFGLTISTAYGGGAIAMQATSVRIRGCYFKNNYNVGGQIAEQNGPGPSGAVCDWTVSDCTFVINAEPSMSSTSAIEVTGKNYAFSGNVFDGGKASAIVFEAADGTTAGNAAVTGGVMINTDVGVNLAQFGSGVCQAIAVTGVKFKGQTTAGVDIASQSASITVTGCDFNECTVPVLSTAAVGQVTLKGNSPGVANVQKFTVANGGTQALPVGAGMLILTDQTIGGSTGVYLLGGPGVALLGQDGSIFVAPTMSPASGKISVQYDGVAFYRVYNNAGGGVTLGYHMDFTRASN